MSSGHHHDDHHSTEQKPVSFTVPFFLAAAFILAVVMFLSLCDPKPHHADEEEHGHGQAHGGPSKAVHHEHDAVAPAEHEASEEAAATEKKDTMTVETTVPSAEPAKEHH